MSVAPKMIQTDNEVIINLFGGLEIYTSKGKLTEAEFKSPLCCKVLLLLMMNRNRGVSARELSEQLWPDKEYDNPTGNIRTLLYRFRSAFRIISDTDLIVTTPNGYRRLIYISYIQLGFCSESFFYFCSCMTTDHSAES